MFWCWRCIRWTERTAQEVVDAYLGATLAPIEVVGGLPPRRLQRVFPHIRENIARDLSCRELAQTVGMSQYYFSKLFKMSTGTTPHQYVMRQRVERAQEHLRETRTALAEVATLVGFETQSHFTSVFRRLVGATPKHYREMHQTASHRLPARLEHGARAETANRTPRRGRGRRRFGCHPERSIRKQSVRAISTLC